MGPTRLLALAGLLLLSGVALARNFPQLAPGRYDWAEPGNVAAALAEGRGFSDPFTGGTGATAWVSPLPVWVEAAVFAACGVKTAAAAKVLLVLSVLGLAGALALLVSALAPHGAALRAAAAASFVLYAALLPGSPLEVLSEAWLDLLLSAALLWAALAVRRAPGPRAAGTLAAVAFLAPLDNAGLAAAVGLVLVILAWQRRRQPRGLLLPLAAAVAAALATAGWAARNTAALGRFIPLKSNGWFELHLANVDSADGLPRMETVLRRLPFFDVREFQRYSELGEVRYVDSFRAPALAALRADPAHFAANILRRIYVAAVFCRREGGGEPTRYAFRPDDEARLAAAGELIPFGGKAGALWTRIDASPAAEAEKFRHLGLADEPGAFADWARRRDAFDAEFRSPWPIAVGFLSAGVPVAALLGAALLGRGKMGAPADWALVIGCGMLLPYVLVNNNDRHQLPLFAMQAVALGAFAQAVANRRVGGRAAA
jgi:hypothetical protein